TRRLPALNPSDTRAETAQEQAGAERRRRQPIARDDGEEVAAGPFRGRPHRHPQGADAEHREHQDRIGRPEAFEELNHSASVGSATKTRKHETNTTERFFVLSCFRGKSLNRAPAPSSTTRPRRPVPPSARS